MRSLEVCEGVGVGMRDPRQVDGELESYHKSNAELDLLIGTLRQQLDETQAQMTEERCVVGRNRCAGSGDHRAFSLCIVCCVCRVWRVR